MTKNESKKMFYVPIETLKPMNQPTAQTRFRDYPDVLTVSQSAELLGVCNNTVYKLVRDQQLPSRRIGTAIRIRKKDLIAFIKSAS